MLLGTFRYINMFRRAMWNAFQHGAFAIAKAAAYSSILTVFPALIVLAWVLSETNTAELFLNQIAYGVGVVLPPGSRSAAAAFLQNHHHRPVREIVSASFIMLFAASGVMISWMEGFRRAYCIPERLWGFWWERAVAFFLVFLGLIPMVFAMSLVAFGNQFEIWVLRAQHGLGLGGFILFLWTAVRWLIAAITSVTVIMLIYHWGLPRVQPWHRVLPGAILATILWFPFTLAFGQYVTKYASYNLIYGSMGAAIALLVWLYSISFIIIVGAEFNAQTCPRAPESPKRRARSRRKR